MATVKSKKSTAKDALPQAKRRKSSVFLRAGGLLASQIRTASEQRGFLHTRLLTQWAEVAGADVASIARPVKVSYPNKGLGATLTLLTTGANAPLLQMQLPQILDRVNATYGYAAISRIHITQTSPSGFSEVQADEQTAPPKKRPLQARDKEKIAQIVSDVSDEGLKAALTTLGENILTKSNS